ncbi:hypothetical protein NVP1084O_011 [Vibrio phage 1.084.O._10N.261.49.F5]|nr:hypothetical protein NVP1084O_011 [Vibrio phage 1.084.O._10N.261.49.F5]
MDNFETQRLAQEIADSHTKLELAKKIIELAESLYCYEVTQLPLAEYFPFKIEDYV